MCPSVQVGWAGAPTPKPSNIVSRLYHTLQADERTSQKMAGIADALACNIAEFNSPLERGSIRKAQAILAAAMPDFDISKLTSMINPISDLVSHIHDNSKHNEQALQFCRTLACLTPDGSSVLGEDSPQPYNPSINPTARDPTSEKRRRDEEDEGPNKKKKKKTVEDKKRKATDDEPDDGAGVMPANETRRGVTWADVHPMEDESKGTGAPTGGAPKKDAAPQGKGSQTTDKGKGKGKDTVVTPQGKSEVALVLAPALAAAALAAPATLDPLGRRADLTSGSPSAVPPSQGAGEGGGGGGASASASQPPTADRMALIAMAKTLTAQLCDEDKLAGAPRCLQRPPLNAPTTRCPPLCVAGISGSQCRFAGFHFKDGMRMKQVCGMCGNSTLDKKYDLDAPPAEGWRTYHVTGFQMPKTGAFSDRHAESRKASVKGPYDDLPRTQRPNCSEGCRTHLVRPHPSRCTLLALALNALPPPHSGRFLCAAGTARTSTCACRTSRRGLPFKPSSRPSSKTPRTTSSSERAAPPRTLLPDV